MRLVKWHEFLEGYFLGLVRYKVLTVLHDLENGLVDAIETEALGLASWITYIVLDVHGKQ